jgi:hypothetical protein
MRTGYFLAGIGWLALLALPVSADTQFRARKMTRDDVPFGKGQCDIRLQIDGEAEVSVRGDEVSIRTISGRDGRDDGSECNEPLPGRNLQNFKFEVRDSRGDIRLLSEPSSHSHFQAIVRIRDGSSGEGRYHFRLTWNLTGQPASSGRPFDDRGGKLEAPGRGPLAWNNVTHFAGRGQGTSEMTGYNSQRLLDSTVDIDRGGRILVSFRTDNGPPLSFSGSLIGSDREGLRADVASDDRSRLRGTMYLSRDGRGDISRISLDATNGPDRLRVNWNRR